ncbi:SDR family NAD(P)-dependent oxidoreductase [Rhodococcus antarcticus]|uniref:SDR family NAD(P)-dependent oxidoreductase n=1 Tax=Rhodococcus antarcticus TaxID=2987751 RepID=A0ABY6P3Y0_9NOCA|nr:SDR family NAD(P)-dependent oxidoreductase [Rhodococcus antarcticus]UZJ26357.1 SDR family NAD(P)-dependent oxidoreductase [Rhodococcus antarcticus]
MRTRTRSRRRPTPTAPPTHPVVLVTGASSGIGRATAELYAGRGARLVLCSRSADALERVRARCADLGAEVEVVVTDVADAAQVQSAVDRAVARFGRLDVCVSAAAVMSYGQHADTPAEVFDRVVTVNLLGAANVARSALGVFRAQEQGTLVVVGSLLGRAAVPLAGSYVASKFGLRGLTRTLRQESRDHPGVHVTSVAPGAVRTPIYAQAATVIGRTGSPPPPVTTPERVAVQVLRAVEHGSRERDADALGGLLNKGMSVAFTVLPGLYDVLVGPMMRTLGVSRKHRPNTEGNVFVPVAELER